MILLAGPHKVCFRYARDSRLGREGRDWRWVCREEQLRGIEGVHRNAGSPNRMIVLWHEPGYFGNDARFFEVARAQGLIGS